MQRKLTLLRVVSKRAYRVKVPAASRNIPQESVELPTRRMRLSKGVAPRAPYRLRWIMAVRAVELRDGVVVATTIPAVLRVATLRRFLTSSPFVSAPESPLRNSAQRSMALGLTWRGLTEGRRAIDNSAGGA